MVLVCGSETTWKRIQITFYEHQPGSLPVRIGRKLATCFGQRLVKLEPPRVHVLDPVFRRLAIDVMVAELVWHGMRHQHRLASALEDGKEILEETFLDMLDKLARPDDIGLADVLRAIGEVVHA